MNTVVMIFENLAFMICVVFSVYTLINYINHARYKRSKSEIINLQSKIVTLKNVLKVRVKNKVNSFKDRMSDTLHFDSTLNYPLNELLALQFQNGRELQRYFDMSYQVNEMTTASLKAINKLSEQEQAYEEEKKSLSKADQYRQGVLSQISWFDNKGELGIVRAIRELYHVNEILNYSIDEFNSNFSNRKKFRPFKKEADYHFPALGKVHEVFMDPDRLIKLKEAEAASKKNLAS